MERYTIFCSQEQTEKAYKLGAPVEIIKTDNLIQYHVYLNGCKYYSIR